MSRILKISLLVVVLFVSVMAVAESMPKEVKSQIKTLQKEGWTPVDAQEDGVLADQVRRNFILECEEFWAPDGTQRRKYIKGLGLYKTASSLTDALTMAGLVAQNQISSDLKTNINHFMEMETIQNQSSATEVSTQNKTIQSSVAQTKLIINSGKLQCGLRLYREVGGQTEVMLTLYYPWPEVLNTQTAE